MRFSTRTRGTVQQYWPSPCWARRIATGRCRPESTREEWPSAQANRVRWLASRPQLPSTPLGAKKASEAPSPGNTFEGAWAGLSVRAYELQPSLGEDERVGGGHPRLIARVI